MPEAGAVHVEHIWIAIAAIVVPICFAILSTAAVAILRMGRILQRIDTLYTQNTKEHLAIEIAQKAHGERLAKVETSINHGILPIAERRIGAVEDKHDKLSHKVARMEVHKEHE
jgi:hypothetical protein